jgi:IS30 family transposase
MSGAEPLRAQEREIISRELARDKSARFIGKLLGRHHSTIAREIERNGGAAEYRAIAAQERYDQYKVRPKERKLVTSTRLHDAVNEGMENKWSPEQISTRLNTDYPDNPEMRVSHETIYQTLYLQAKGELRTELKLALRQGRARRVPRSRASLSRGKIPDMVNISERPAEADDRAVPGFWEGDCATWKVARSEWSYRVEDRLIGEGVTRFSVSRTVPALACVMGDCGVRSPGEKPKWSSFHPWCRWLPSRRVAGSIGLARQDKRILVSPRHESLNQLIGLILIASHYIVGWVERFQADD